MSANLLRVVDETSLALQRLEATQLNALRGYLEESSRRLQVELRRAWPAVLEETAMASRIVREARARALLLQVDTALEALRLGPATGVPDVMRNLIVMGRTTEATQTQAFLAEMIRAAGSTVVLSELEALVRMSTAVNMTAVEAQLANASARLYRYGAQAVDKVNQAVVDGIVRGSGWRPVSMEIRDALTGDPAARPLRRTGLDSMGRVRKDLLVRGSGGLAFQAETIARTELISSLQDARDERYRAAGIDQVIWLATQDDRVCIHCGVRSGNVYRRDDVVIPAHPRCRCVASPIKQSWVDAGVVDLNDLSDHRAGVARNFEAATGKPLVDRGQLTPFERANGATQPPRPITLRPPGAPQTVQAP